MSEGKTPGVGDPAPGLHAEDDRAQGSEPQATTGARTSCCSSTRSTGRPADPRACPPSTGASGTSRRRIPRCWVSARTARSATRTGRSRSASRTTRCSPTSTGRSAKDYGVYWPDWNANVRATFVVDKQGTIRFVERYGKGELPEPGQDPRRGQEAGLGRGRGGAWVVRAHAQQHERRRPRSPATRPPRAASPTPAPRPPPAAGS